MIIIVLLQQVDGHKPKFRFRYLAGRWKLKKCWLIYHLPLEEEGR